MAPDFSEADTPLVAADPMRRDNAAILRHALASAADRYRAGLADPADAAGMKAVILRHALAEQARTGREPLGMLAPAGVPQWGSLLPGGPPGVTGTPAEQSAHETQQTAMTMYGPGGLPASLGLGMAGAAALPKTVRGGRVAAAKPAAAAPEPLFTEPSGAVPKGRTQAALPRYVGKGPSARVTDAVANPAVRDGLLAMAKAGEGWGRRWYNTQQMRDAWISELGPEEGAKWFESYVRAVAATTNRSGPYQNFKEASYYYRLLKSGEPLPRPFQEGGKGSWHAAPVEPGYGHFAGAIHQRNVIQTFEKGGLDPLANQKPASFTENLLGNYGPATVDSRVFQTVGRLSKDPRFLADDVRWTKKDPVTGAKVTKIIHPSEMYKKGELTMEEAVQDPVYWEAAPRKHEYGAVEGMLRDLGAGLKRPIKPAQFQAAMWGKEGEKSAVETFGNVVTDRAAELGATPRDTLRRFIRGDIALSIGGSVIVFSQLPQAQQDELTKAHDGGR